MALVARAFRTKLLIRRNRDRRQGNLLPPDAEIIATMSFRTFIVQLASLVAGLVFPAYGSIAAIESNTGEDDTHWLIYWLIFSLLTIVENIAWPLLKWVPLYGELKVAVLIWLVAPQTKGALWVYESFLSQGLAVLRTEVMKIPAARSALAKFDSSVSDVPLKTRSEADTAAETSRRRSKLGAVLKDVSTAFESDLRRIDGIVKPKDRYAAENAFDKGLNRLSKVASAREAGSDGRLFSNKFS